MKNSFLYDLVSMIEAGLNYLSLVYLRAAVVHCWDSETMKKMKWAVKP
jgi:hypothetical protein